MFLTENIMETTLRKIHPLVAGAAVSIILVSLVGVAAMTGILPGAHGQNQPQGVIDSTGQIVNPQTGAPMPQQTQQGVQGAMSNNTAPAVAGTAAAGAPPADAGVPPANTPAPMQPEAAPCNSCGIVESVRPVQHQAQTSGIGAVAGAVIGGVIGNRFGGGNGRALSTAGGAVGGGIVGNEIEKHGKTTLSYQVTVKMETGKMRTFSYNAQPGWNPGDRVQVVRGALETRA